MSGSSAAIELSYLVLGVGNVLRGDDGIGCYVATRLAGLVAEAGDTRLRIQSIDCGLTPENYTGVLRRARPDTLVLVDAAEMGLAVGEIRTVSPERAGSIGMSTHSMPLSLFVSYVQGLCNKIVIVGIQPGHMGLSNEMSQDVRSAGDSLAQLLLEGRLDRLQPLD